MRNEETQAAPSTARSTTALARVAPAYITSFSRRGAPGTPHTLPDASDPRVSVLGAPESPRAESFRALRDRLLARTLPKVLAVTSPGRGEGKTTCAVNLAAALAERAMSDVLLVEGNLGEPALAPLFGIDEATKPASWAPLPWLGAYKVVEIADGLCVAAIVPCPGDARPRLDPRWFDLVLGHVERGPFDHVLLDLPALDVAPAVARVAGAAGGALLAARAGVTTARALRDAARDLSETRTVGVALMDGTR